MKGGRIVAWLIIAFGVAIGVIGSLWLVAGIADGRLRVTGAALGFGLMAVIVLPVVGVGIYLLVRSGQEAKEDAARADLRRILDEVKAKGSIPISDLVLEMGSTRDKIQQDINALVGMGLFSGYVNWDEGVLYSQDAAALRSLDKCKNCGGELKLVGKGVVKCPYCGTEYFLP